VPLKKSVEIQPMWNIKCFVIPVKSGTTGTVTKGLKMPGNNARKAFNSFSTRNSCAIDTAHNKYNMKLEV
jgi:hypothetical protein